MTKKQKLIEELTTHKCDFQRWPMYPVRQPDTRPRELPETKPPPPYVYIDPQSHAPYSPSVYVPFDLYAKPKPIVGTDPRECLSLEKPAKSRSFRESVTIPTSLPPTVPLNKIKCEEDLETVLKYTYVGVHKILMKEAALSTEKRPHPPNRLIPEANDMRFRQEIYPALPPGWVSAAKHWDCLQSRNLGDPKKSFWERKGPLVECSGCCNPLTNMLPKEMKEEISRLTCEGNLRLAYDVTKTGYGGYRQTCAKGVPLSKTAQ